MSYIISDYIISPLAFGTENNLKAVLQKQTSVQYHRGIYKNSEPYFASTFDRLQFAKIDFSSDLKINEFSFFECLIIYSILQANTMQIDLGLSEVLFILSSTKGNIEFLGTQKDISLVASAKKTARYFNNPNQPIVVSNACISGVCALILADRILKRQCYKTIVVCGCDVLSDFIISGFQSLKALSTHLCKPFDRERNGLNLGEAACCVILSNDDQYSKLRKGAIISGSIHNDANHISGPSRTAEGAYRCLKDVIGNNKDNIAFINLHGTATLYNDEMESIAINRAETQHIPVNGFKANFGHTLGASGVLETILSMHALSQGIILPTFGFTTLGTSQPINVSSSVRYTNKTDCIKLISGFGGCNAAIRVCKNNPLSHHNANIKKIKICHTITISSHGVTIDDISLNVAQKDDKLLVELYKKYVGDYPKFYKMDILCRLGFLSCELLLQASKEERFIFKEDRAVIIASKTGCIDNDMNFWHTYAEQNNYYPSPALFTYTLPNIVTGEIAIRNKYYGETSFYLLESKQQFDELIQQTSTFLRVKSAVLAWIESPSKNDFLAQASLVHFG